MGLLTVEEILTAIPGLDLKWAWKSVQPQGKPKTIDFSNQ